MDSPFTITVASNTVILDNQRQAQISFTVRNICDRPLPSLARLASQNISVLNWLSIIGEIERDLPAAGTVQYEVRIVVPATVWAGDYSFRLDMIGLENPDECFTQGPTVTFTAPPVEVHRPCCMKIRSFFKRFQI